MKMPKAIDVISFIAFLGAAVAARAADYQKGTITKQTGGVGAYQLDGGSTKYGIERCGKFQDGQAVEFRIADDKAYIRRENGGEYKCNIVMRSGAPEAPAVPTYIKGTILGYGVRRDTHVSSGANGSVTSWNRKAKVYELKGPELIYQVDYCGAFQAGHFSPGQEVEFRVNEKEGRLYIRHDVSKEYSCQLEGTRLPDNAVPAVSAAPSKSETKASDSDTASK
jgi:hypothetical protein